MAQKWNLQDIRPAEPRRPRPRPTQADMLLEQPPSFVSKDSIPSVVIESGKKRDKSHLLISLALFVVIVGGAIGLSAMFAQTELTVTPHTRQPNVSAEFVAYPDKRDGELSYEVMTIEATGESQVKATGQVEVTELATGFIEVLKTTPGAERLRIHTRFRNTDGLIFKLKEAVVVPGAVKDESGTMVPGVIRAEVFANDVGEQYNLSAGNTFDIPGFQESNLTELHKAITGRNPEAFTGGFSGPQFQIDPGELATAKQALDVKLRDELLAKIESQRPAGFVSFPDAVAITYNELPAVEYKDGDVTNLVTIREQAVLQIPLFEKVEFGSYLAKESVPTYSGEAVRVNDPSALVFRYTNPTTSASVIANEPSLTFNLTGKPLLVWEFDGEKLRKDLAGLSKTAISNVIKAYPGIKMASARITPFWHLKFPEGAEEIIITEELVTDEQ